MIEIESKRETWMTTCIRVSIFTYATVIGYVYDYLSIIYQSHLKGRFATLGGSIMMRKKALRLCKTRNEEEISYKNLIKDNYMKYVQTIRMCHG